MFFQNFKFVASIVLNEEHSFITFQLKKPVGRRPLELRPNDFLVRIIRGRLEDLRGRFVPIFIMIRSMVPEIFRSVSGMSRFYKHIHHEILIYTVLETLLL